MGVTRLVSRRRQDPGTKWARIAMAVLATVGVIDTGSITLKRWGFLGELTCPMGADGCDKVLNSSWGTLINGIPLSLVGLIAYISILLMTLMPLLPGLQENKADLSRRTWWGLFTLSTSMAAFSAVLLGLAVLKIQAFCFFCVLSASLSILLLVLSIVGGGWEDSGILAFRGVLLATVVLLGSLIWISAVDSGRSANVGEKVGVPPAVTNESSIAALALAEHLAVGGAVMYSAYWCPHCHEQKELFGKQASQQLIVVECATDGQNNQADLCRSKRLEGFPSWEINGEIDSGVKPLSILADLSGYQGSREF
ncbi:vitamin K epoxide reductase family protein [Synechococcus sp. M16CYN]|uniref:vitamin K epoxide reductase family protein n=1 Tax=Synechococcus sp. M16CYN TaxID=3103139 RepID=UPI0032523D37